MQYDTDNNRTQTDGRDACIDAPDPTSAEDSMSLIWTEHGDFDYDAPYDHTVAEQRTRRLKLICSKMLAGLNCTDFACSRAFDHPPICAFCGSMIDDEDDVTLCGPHRDVTAHERCAERHYGEER